MAAGESAIARYDLSGREAAGLGMIYWGNLSVLLHVMLSTRANISKSEELLDGVNCGARLLRATRVQATGDAVETTLTVLHKSTSMADRMPHEVIEKGGNGKRALITSPDKLHDALSGMSGTHFVGRI